MSKKQQPKKQQLKKFFRHKKLENIQLIEGVERTLTNNRGYVFKMPKPKTPVILLLSGGLDSVSTWKILVKRFKLNVYPVVFQDPKEPRAGERRAVKDIARYFKKPFGKLYHEPQFFTVSFLANEYRRSFDQHLYKNPQAIASFLDERGYFNVDLPGLTGALALYAMQFRNSLFFKSNLKINTIFSSVVRSDGEAVAHQTFTASRAIMLMLNGVMGEKHLQFTSLAFEPELFETYLDTADLLELQKRTKPALPVEKTWSCLMDYQHQCGVCRSCLNRKAALKTAGITDTTYYRQPLSSKVNIFNQVKQWLKKVLQYDRRFE